MGGRQETYPITQLHYNSDGIALGLVSLLHEELVLTPYGQMRIF